MEQQHRTEPPNQQDCSTVTHNAAILDQFTRQAIPFATAPNIRNQEMLDRIVAMSEPKPDDTVLDVACGPGLLTCTFAHKVRHATGIDMTPAMLEQAKIVQKEQGLANLAWDTGDATALPYGNGTFSIVATRFTFHHFLDPLAALKEMRRVCRPGGRIVVADSSPVSEKADAFNAMERLRDPSHTRALPPEELRDLFVRAGLGEPRMDAFRLEGDLDDLLARSFPNKGDEARIRKMFNDSLSGDTLDLATHLTGGMVLYGFPIVVLAATNR